MKVLLKRIPWFYILITIYPLLFLWTVNVSEIYASAVIHPLLITLIGSSVLYAILYIGFRNIEKAALVGIPILLAFFSYGHLYYDARTTSALYAFSHHSVLIPVYVIVFGFWIWWVSFRVKRYAISVRYLNIMSLVLVVMQVVQLSYYYVRTFYGTHRSVTLQSGLTITNQRPDIYFIVLDAYMRADMMKQDLGFDNSQFIDQLEQMGFYVAHCSRPNYNFTRGSISSTLNMKFIPDTENDIADSALYASIKNNEVRQQLESIGYQTVSFRGDFPWSVMDDADVLFEEKNPANWLSFESLYTRSTAVIILSAIDSNVKISQYFDNIFNHGESSSDLSGLDFENREFVRAHVNAGLFILDKLPDAVDIYGPKFVYAHIPIPHYPYAFGPNGEIMTDPDFYSGRNGDTIFEEYRRQGYINQVQFINKQIIPILQTIIKKSKTPPIIILEGDHGLYGDNRYTNLNVYYLPNGYDNLYETITPVNSFRLVFDEYFGANYPLLPDITYEGGYYPATGTYMNCMP